MTQEGTMRIIFYECPRCKNLNQFTPEIEPKKGDIDWLECEQCERYEDYEFDGIDEYVHE